VKWTEVNITPAGRDRDGFLAEVIAPWLQGNPGLESWHFLWEPQEDWRPGKKISDDGVVLRFRILSSEGTHRKALLAALEKAQDGNLIREFYEGAHGERGGKYEGEHKFYGNAAWPATYQCWHALSVLALQLSVQAAADGPELPRSHHWKRLAHLSANMLRLPDVRLNLEQGHRYLQVKATLLDEELSAADRKIADALDQYLYQEDVI
jgi:hypothetical protein